MQQFWQKRRAKQAKASDADASTLGDDEAAAASSAAAAASRPHATANCEQQRTASIAESGASSMNAAPLEAASSAEESSPSALTATSLSRDYFRLKSVCDWKNAEQPLRSITSGYNHGACLNEKGLSARARGSGIYAALFTGEIFTFGRALEKQLGFGSKLDKQVPTQLTNPLGVYWRHILCGRNSTAAISDGKRRFLFCRLQTLFIYIFSRRCLCLVSIGMSSLVKPTFQGVETIAANSASPAL